MKVLALASYPVEAAATRYRLEQFVRPLAERGIQLTIHPFLDSRLFSRLYRREAIVSTGVGLISSAVKRLRDVWAANQADVVFVQREAMMFGPPVIEWVLTHVLKRPMVLDLDDATYVSYTSPTYGQFGKSLTWFGKTDDLIRWAKVVACGNSGIADYVKNKGTAACVVPTVVDTDVFRPTLDKHQDQLVLGWIGTHSTFPFLESIFPALQRLATDHTFTLKVVGAGTRAINLPGVEVETLPWKLDREVQDFQSIDIGLYPIDHNRYSMKWASGKSGFKAIQYMAVGIPYVATPIGASAEIGEPGITHLVANSSDEWHSALELLISDAEKRRRMGHAGREHVIKHYALQEQANKLADILRKASAT